jgi:hypothetical protein
MKLYEIIRQIDDEIYVTILTSGTSSDYWTDLNSELEKRFLNSSKVVYIDLLFVNGPKNRFFMTHYNHSVLEIRTRKADNDLIARIKPIFDKYFRMNRNLLDFSSMSSADRLSYFEMLNR